MNCAEVVIDDHLKKPETILVDGYIVEVGPAVVSVRLTPSGQALAELTRCQQPQIVIRGNFGGDRQPRLRIWTAGTVTVVGKVTVPKGGCAAHCSATNVLPPYDCALFMSGEMPMHVSIEDSLPHASHE